MFKCYVNELLSLIVKTCGELDTVKKDINFTRIEEVPYEDYEIINGIYYIGNDLLNKYKSDKHKEINQDREQARLNEGAEFDNDLFDIDEKSQANITAIVSILLANNVPEQFVSIYRSKTNKDHSFNKAQMIELGTVIGAKVTEIYQKSWDLKALVDNARTKEEISLCRSKNEIECLSDIVFPSNKL